MIESSNYSVGFVQIVSAVYVPQTTDSWIELIGMDSLGPVSFETLVVSFCSFSSILSYELIYFIYFRNAWHWINAIESWDWTPIIGDSPMGESVHQSFQLCSIRIMLD